MNYTYETKRVAHNHNMHGIHTYILHTHTYTYKYALIHPKLLALLSIRTVSDLQCLDRPWKLADPVMYVYSLFVCMYVCIYTVSDLQ